MEPTTRSADGRRSDAFLLLLLLTFAAALHAWVFSQTRMASRDSIGFIRYALELEQKPWREALPEIEQPPLFPLALLAVSQPVRYLMGTTPQAMVVSAQLTATVAGVFLVVPMFFLGKELFDRRVGFWAAVLFQSLPVAAHVTCDALSEALFLLFSAAALLFAARGFRLRSAASFALCGGCSGLAYLARPEGALMGAAAFGVLVMVQCLPVRRWAWPRAVACGAALTLAAAVVAGPYMVAIGGVTLKPTGRKMLGTLKRDDTLPPRPEARIAGGPVLAFTWAAWMQPGEGTDDRPTLWWGLFSLTKETLRTFQWVFWAPALLGVWIFRGKIRETPGSWVVCAAAGGLWLVLWFMAVRVGYVSERHLLLPILCFSYPTVACLAWCGDRLWPQTDSGRWRTAAVVWLALTTGWNLPWAAKALHLGRLGHKEAGLWIAEHGSPGDPVVDPYCWAHYYAGRVLQEGEPATAVLPAMRYVVLEVSGNPHSRLPVLPEALKLSHLGHKVYEWQPTKKQHDRDKAETVAVFAVPGTVK